MASDDVQYFHQRAAEERQRAAAASDPKSHAVHLEMARRYEEALAAVGGAHQLRSATDAIRRSHDLLSDTSRLVHDAA